MFTQIICIFWGKRQMKINSVFPSILYLRFFIKFSTIWYRWVSWCFLQTPLYISLNACQFAGLVLFIVTLKNHHHYPTISYKLAYLRTYEYALFNLVITYFWKNSFEVLKNYWLCCGALVNRCIATSFICSDGKIIFSFLTSYS